MFILKWFKALFLLPKALRWEPSGDDAERDHEQAVVVEDILHCSLRGIIFLTIVLWIGLTALFLVI